MSRKISMVSKRGMQISVHNDEHIYVKKLLTMQINNMDYLGFSLRIYCLDMMMFSWIFTYVKACQILHFKCI